MSTLKRVLALSLALMMAMSIGVFAKFEDAEDFDESCVDAIEMLSALEILTGYTDGTFGPSKTITRAEVAAMMYRLYTGGNEGYGVYADMKTFSDVSPDAWYAGYVNYCASVGIIAGRSPTVFDPNTPVTGYELAKMLLVVANYNPDVQGYTGDKWMANVLRDCNLSGLIDGYNYQMDQAAPRQWAAKMFETLILDVELAQYIGDLLVTGSGLEYNKGKTVGEARLKLEVFEGKLTQNLDFNLGGGADEYDYSIVQRETGDTTTATTEINYAADKALLGQKVKVVAKLVNANLTGSAKYATKNLIILNVSATGDSAVVTAAVGDITFSTNTAKDTLTVKHSAFNGNKASAFDGDLTTGIVYNNYKNVSFASATAAAGALGYLGNDLVTIVDYENDGKVDNIIVEKVTYAEVTSINNDRIITNALSKKIDEVNFVGETPVRGDVVSLTETYVAGDLIIDIAVIEATEGLKVTKWQEDGGAYDTLTIDGTTYDVATTSTAKVDRKHTIFFFDGDYVVYSMASKTDTSTALDTAVGIVTGISVDDNKYKVSQRSDDLNATDSYGFKVRYMGLDGKIVSAKWYSFDNDSDDYGYATGNVWSEVNNLTSPGTLTTWGDSIEFESEYNAEKVYAQIGGLTKYGFTSVNASTFPTLTEPMLVIIEQNSDGTVTFYKYDGAKKGDNTAAFEASYSASKGTLTFTDKTLYITDTTQVFFQYEDGFKLVKGADLNAFSAADYDIFVASYINDDTTGEAQAVYLYTAGAIPGKAATVNYAAVTGSNGNWSTGFSLNGNTSYTYDVNTAVGKDGSFTLTTSSVKPTRYKVFTYDTHSTGRYHVPAAIDYTDGEVGRITNIDYTNEYFVMDGTRYYYSEDTVIFEVTASSAKVITTPYTTIGNSSVFVIHDDNDCELIVINSEGGNVRTNLWGTAIGASVAVTSDTQASYSWNFSTTPANNCTLTATVGNKDAEATYSYQWYRNDTQTTTGGTSISGATDEDYVLQAADVGKYIYCVITSNINVGTVANVSNLITQLP